MGAVEELGEEEEAAEVVVVVGGWLLARGSPRVTRAT